MDDSPLFMLSPELRNIIYEFVLCHQRPIVIFPKHPPGPLGPIKPMTPVSDTKRNGHIDTSLLQVCKDVRQETSELFFAINTFHIRFNIGIASPARFFHDFVAKIGEKQAAALRTVSLREPERHIHDLPKTIAAVRKVLASYPRCAVDITITVSYDSTLLPCGRIRYPSCSTVLTFELRDLLGSFERAKERLAEEVPPFSVNGELEAARKLVLGEMDHGSTTEAVKEDE